MTSYTQKPLMTENHPITPPPELVQQWYDQAKQDPCGPINWVAVKAAQWGADKELEACCEWVGAVDGKYGPRLRLARRPKPLSLKEQALDVLEDLSNGIETADSWFLIQSALEQLDD